MNHGNKIGRQLDPEIWAIPEKQKTRQHSPFAGTPGRMLRCIGVEMVDVAGYLIMQKSLCFLAAASEQAEVAERRDNGCIACGSEFSSGIAKMTDHAIVDVGA